MKKLLSLKPTKSTQITAQTDLNIDQLIEFFSNTKLSPNIPKGWDRDDLVKYLEDWKRDSSPTIQIQELATDQKEIKSFLDTLNTKSTSTPIQSTAAATAGMKPIDPDFETKGLIRLFLETPEKLPPSKGIEPELDFVKGIAKQLEEVRSTRVGAFDRSDNPTIIFDIQEQVSNLLKRAKANNPDAIATVHYLKKSEFFKRFAVNIFKLHQGELLCHESDISMPLLQELSKSGFKCKFQKKGAEIVPIDPKELESARLFIKKL